MDNIREYLKNRWVTAALGFVIGTLFGLIVLGWGLFPVNWTDGTPANLRSDLQQDYLRMAVQSFTADRNIELAKARFNELGEDGQAAMDALKKSGKVSLAEADAFASAIKLPSTGAVATEPAATLKPGATAKATTAPGASTEKPKKSSGLILLAVLVVLLVVIAAALAYFLMGKPRGATGEISPAQQSAKFNRAAEQTDYVQAGQEAPVAQFMTTYTSGDDLYDDSFSIDSPSGEFLGECGVGISETIGVGDPKKVTAFEVWLFDKNDIQTVTKVLMSAHAFDDPSISGKLMSKGEPVLAEPGKRVLLETATLQLEARVVDMSFGQGALPANSFFDRLTLELAVWPKVAAEA